MVADLHKHLPPSGLKACFGIEPVVRTTGKYLSPSGLIGRTEFQPAVYIGARPALSCHRAVSIGGDQTDLHKPIPWPEQNLASPEGDRYLPAASAAGYPA
ncbi:hypothetical protein FF011L_25310 [Roseimaritima multifibrata]|uniref:Uncharacterized protein n=1 Tax=Roseimaritima multifibrata TaxID=1930274 RepID=A0A517MFU9_9BACT|nr:hypothetical protein FF011L_25310 [Roseimaritima multifibrata]